MALFTCETAGLQHGTDFHGFIQRKKIYKGVAHNPPEGYQGNIKKSYSEVRFYNLSNTKDSK